MPRAVIGARTARARISSASAARRGSRSSASRAPRRRRPRRRRSPGAPRPRRATPRRLMRSTIARVVAVAVAGEDDQVAVRVRGEPLRAGVGHRLVPDHLHGVDRDPALGIAGASRSARRRCASAPAASSVRLWLAVSVRRAAAHVLHQRVEPRAMRLVVELELGNLGPLVGRQRLEAVVRRPSSSAPWRALSASSCAVRGDRGVRSSARRAVVVAPAILPAGRERSAASSMRFAA